ncbi:MAG: GFA family protein [Boseongicola sp.]
MHNHITGHCLCGATQYSVAGQGRFGIICFCADCQRATGTGGAPQLAVSANDLSVVGPLKTYGQKADSGSDLVFQFCSECGSPLIKTTSRTPELAFLYAGTLDQPEVFADPKLVFEESRQPWDR